MKTLAAIIVLSFCMSGAVRVWAAEQTTSGSTTNPAPENLGCDVVDGKTNKIDHVYAVTPVYVQVIYEGGHGSRKIPRQELPPELQAKFPYDEKKAAAYEQQQVELAARQAAARSAALRQGIQMREQEILTEIDQLTAQDVQLQKAINLYKNLPPGNGRKAQLAHLFDDRQELQERMLQLRNQLPALRASRDSLY